MPIGQYFSDCLPATNYNCWLGGAFLSAALWTDDGLQTNRPLAVGIAAVLLAGGLLTQLLPEGKPEAEPEDNSAP